MSSFEAFRADLVWNANTGKTEADIEQLRRTAHAAYGSMSDDALRLAVAEDKRDRALAKHGPTSRQAAQAELAYRREVEAVTRASQRQVVALDRTERELGQVTRGALTGSGALRGFARSAALMSATFLGSAGVVYAIRSTIDAAKESQVVVEQTANAVRRAGLDWERYASQVQDAAARQANVSGFDDERLLRTFSLFIRRTRDVNEAIRLNALATDVARGRNIELEQAAQLVIKAHLGQAGALRRLGIDAEKGAKGYELIALLQQKYANSARVYGATAQGAQDRFNVALQNTQELVGNLLLPSVTRYLDAGAEWLSAADNQAQIQREVNELLRTGGQVAQGLAAGLDAVHDVAAPLVGVLGGVEHAVELLVIAMAVGKVRAFAGALGLIGPAATRAATAATAATAIESAGAASLVATGRVNALRGALLRLGAIGVITLGVELVLNRDALDRQVTDFLRGHGLGFLTGGSVDISQPGAYANLPDWAKRQISPQLPAIGRQYDEIEGLRTQRAAEDVVATMGRGRAPSRPSAQPLTAAQLRARNLQDAALDPLGADARAAYEAQADYDRRALAFLEKRRAEGKINNAKYIQLRGQISSDLDSMLSQIRAIDEASKKTAVKAADDASDAAAARRKDRQRALAQIASQHLAAMIGGLKLEVPALQRLAGEANAELKRTLKSLKLGLSADDIREIDDDMADRAAQAQQRSQQIQEQIFQNRLAAAGLIPDEAKRRRVERMIYQDQVAFWHRLAAQETDQLKRLQDQAQELAARSALKQLGSSIAGGQTDFGAVRDSFFTDFQRIVGAYAPNAFGQNVTRAAPHVVKVDHGKLATHAYETVHELRLTNSHFERLVSRGKFPATGYSIASADAAFG